MFEVAAAYIGLALGNKLIDKAGGDIADGFEKGLVKLYNWVKGKLTTRTGGKALALAEKDPEGDDQRELLADALADAVGDDKTAADELAAMIAELDKLRPPGVEIVGLATSAELYGEQIGADVSGPLEPGSKVKGTTEVTGTVHEGAKNIGVKHGHGT